MKPCSRGAANEKPCLKLRTDGKIAEHMGSAPPWNESSAVGPRSKPMRCSNLGMTSKPRVAAAQSAVEDARCKINNAGADGCSDLLIIAAEKDRLSACQCWQNGDDSDAIRRCSGHLGNAHIYLTCSHHRLNDRFNDRLLLDIYLSKWNLLSTR
jgi:hypothetical protein